MGRATKGYVIDHINRDRLCNTRENLRIVTRIENANNISKAKNKSSKHMFISYNKTYEKWQVKYKNIYIGRFESEEIALIKLNEYQISDKSITKIKNLTSKYEGVCYHKDNKKWIATYKKYLGSYDSEEDAYKKVLQSKELADQEKKSINEKHMLKPILRNCENIAIIPVNNINGNCGHCLVDDKIWHELMLHKWSVKANKYAVSRFGSKIIGMHEFVMKKKELEKSEVIDHINNNTFDNRSFNLRRTTYVNNNHNRSKLQTSSSKYFGVSKHKQTKKWKAYINKDHINYYIGCYTDELDAAKAYNEKAIELYGNEANLNIFN